MVCRVWVDEPGLGAVADVELVHAPVPVDFLNFDIYTFSKLLISVTLFWSALLRVYYGMAFSLKLC